MSKSSIVVGALLVAALVGAPVTYGLGWHEVAVALVALPGVVAAAVALDVRTRLRDRVRKAEAGQRTLEKRLDKLAAQARPPARAEAPTYDDLLGTVRVIQAQYTGRLDRAQSSLDEAVRALRAHLDTETRTTE